MEKIKEYEPDFVIVANGAKPNSIPVKGIDNAVQSWDVLNGEIELNGKNIVVIGGGHSVLLPQHLEKADIKAYTSVITKEITNNKVVYQTQNDEEHMIDADLVVTATGQIPIGSELTMKIIEEGIPAISIGDASRTGKIMDAVRSGFNIALEI